MDDRAGCEKQLRETEEKLRKVSEELLALQGAIEELSIGVVPPEWDLDWMLRTGSPKDRLKRVFKRLFEKAGGMKSFAQRTYSEARRYENQRDEARKALALIAEQAERAAQEAAQ